MGYGVGTVLSRLLVGGAAGLVCADLAAAVVTFVATGWFLIGVFGPRPLFRGVRQSLG